MLSVKEQINIIKEGTEEIININELEEKLVRSQKENRPLVVKLGLDPSAPDIHLGHTVVLRKMKQLQDLGHRVVIIIGDFTGMIGDPTGKSKTRKQLTREQVLENARTYQKQVFKVLDRNKTELRFNGEWLGKLNFKDVIELASKYTVARMLEREDFKNRFQNQMSIGIHEFFYPLMQAYDSLEIKADIEFGGTDQRFNVLMGRTLQEEYGMEKQIVIFMPLLEGIDGSEKMSKSLGNYIGIDEEANIMYEKCMKVPDNLIIKYFELTTDVDSQELLREERVNPRDIKMRLGREIVKLYHGEEAAVNAEEHFKIVFQNKEVPEDIDEIEACPDEGIVDVIMKAGLATSRSEVRRLIDQGGVKVNGRTLEGFKDVNLSSGDVIKIGKNKFAKILMKKESFKTI